MLQSVEGMDQIVANLGLPKRQEQSDSGRVESDTYSMDRSVASHLPTEYVDHSSVNLSTNPQQASSSSDNPQLVAGQNDSMSKMKKTMDRLQKELAQQIDRKWENDEKLAAAESSYEAQKLQLRKAHEQDKKNLKTQNSALKEETGCYKERITALEKAESETEERYKNIASEKDKLILLVRQEEDKYKNSQIEINNLKSKRKKV